MTDQALAYRDKLNRGGPKALIGYLIGYESSNIYRIWNLASNRVLTRRDVVFDENTRFSGDLQALKDELKEADPVTLS